jgi:exo-beta-1,3-glucanase (GH17 family)
MKSNRHDTNLYSQDKSGRGVPHFGARYLMGFFLAVGSLYPLLNCHAKSANWAEKFSALVWVAYSPPAAEPIKGVDANAESMRADLAVLRQAGFTGLVTYSCSGLLGRDLVEMAKAQGFQGLILGVWDPANQREIDAVKVAGKDSLVLGVCVGNEGLRRRYQLPALTAAIEDIRKALGKPVTTTEIIEEYADESLLQLGDWVFPNAHPYFHNQLDPDAAVRWTQAAYNDLKKRSSHLVIFKEVGLPTAGDSPNRLGAVASPSASEPPFYVYRDADSTDNHFKPTGYMGDIGDIHIDEAYGENPHSGKTCIRIVFDAKGKSPNECAYAPPCKWSGVYWQEPPNNWGKEALWKGKGFDLSRYNRLVFWARADRAEVVEFKVGGINQAYGDSLMYPRIQNIQMSKYWQEFEVNLSEADLRHIIGGFCLVSSRERSPQGITIFLDDIRFQKK